MAQLRSVNTKFWEDPWIESLSISEKLLFLYFLTNSYANLAGIYEISIKRICFETGIDNKTIRKALEGFERVRKAYFVSDNYIFLPNWLKNQNLNTNMQKGVMKIISDLPNEVKIIILGNGYQTLSKDYQTLRNTLLKYEVEVEVLEEEIEEEGEEKETCFSFDEFWNLYPIKKQKKTASEKYAKINETDRLKIKNTLPKFITNKPFASYVHPYPTVYINQQRWDDELTEIVTPQMTPPPSGMRSSYETNTPKPEPGKFK